MSQSNKQPMIVISMEMMGEGKFQIHMEVMSPIGAPMAHAAPLQNLNGERPFELVAKQADILMRYASGQKDLLEQPSKEETLVYLLSRSPQRG